MNRLPFSRRSVIVRSLIEGSSVRDTCRMAGVAKGTVLKLLRELGEACADYQNRHLVQLPCQVIECDEIWSWVGRKERNVPVGQRSQLGRGDVWTWTAICADTKLVPCWHVARRDADAALAFMEDLASRLANCVQLTTDGHNACLSAVEEAFGWNGIDYAMLVKLYGPSELSHNTERTYSHAQVTRTERYPIMGRTDPKRISTSCAVADNLTMRMRNRHMTRLSNSYSKKLANHMAAMSLYFMAYNFVHVHRTLTRAKKGVHTTPAMAADVTDHVWKVEEVVALLG